MKFIIKIILILAANALGIWAASLYVPGFHFSGNYVQLAELAAALALLNLILKPIVKLLLGPLIIITLGLGLVVVNAIMLYALDVFSKNLTIESIPALVYGTLIIGAVNFVVHLIT